MGNKKSSNKGYAENSTCGKAMINPITYKRDVLVQVWVQSRYLVALDQWLDHGGVNLRHLSDIINESIEQIIKSLLDNEEISSLMACQNARDFLQFKYRISLDGNRGQRNALHNLHLDSKIKPRKNEWEDNGSFNEYRSIGSDEEWEKGREMAEKDRAKVTMEKEIEGKKVLDRLKQEPDSIINISLDQLKEVDEKIKVNVDEIEIEIELEPKPVLNKLKMSESEMQAKAREIKQKEIDQEKINQQMMSVPKGGIKNEE